MLATLVFLLAVAVCAAIAFVLWRVAIIYRPLPTPREVFRKGG